jgi:hypothetical protein
MGTILSPISLYQKTAPSPLVAAGLVTADFEFDFSYSGVLTTDILEIGALPANAKIHDAHLYSVANLQVGVITAGSGGTNGTFPLPVIAPPSGGTPYAGTFTIAGGALTAVNLTSPGIGYTGTQTVTAALLAAVSAGFITGSVTLTLATLAAANVTVGLLTGNVGDPSASRTLNAFPTLFSAVAIAGTNTAIARMTIPQQPYPINADQGIGVTFSVAQPVAALYNQTKLRLVVSYYV